MNPQEASRAYLAAQVEGCTPLHRVVLLHQRLARALREAIGHIERREVPAAHEAFTKAKEIVVHLLASIPEDDESDLAAHLRGLLAHCYQQITMANLRKDRQGARAALEVVVALGEGWADLEAQCQGRDRAAASGPDGRR